VTDRIHRYSHEQSNKHARCSWVISSRSRRAACLAGVRGSSGESDFRFKVIGSGSFADELHRLAADWVSRNTSGSSGASKTMLRWEHELGVRGAGIAPYIRELDT